MVGRVDGDPSGGDRGSRSWRNLLAKLTLEPEGDGFYFWGGVWVGAGNLFQKALQMGRTRTRCELK